MNIVIQATVQKEYSLYIAQLFQEYALANAQHNFYFLGDDLCPVDDMPANITAALLPKGVLGKMFAESNLNKQLQNWKADLFITHSSTLKINNTPTIIYLNDDDFDNTALHKKILPGINAAIKIIVENDDAKKKAGSIFNLDEQKIVVLPLTAEEVFTPRNFDQREAAKASHADNREYFFVVWNDASANNFIELLKAFSVFKKWQQSSMKMIVAGELPGGVGDKIKTYKYKEDLVLMDDQFDKQLARLTGGAYAVIHVTNYLIDALQAVQCEVPVISMNQQLKAQFGDGILTPEKPGAEGLGHAMIEIYRSEDLRNNIIAQAKHYAVLREQALKTMEEIV